MDSTLQLPEADDRALRLPAHWQDRSAIESAALATGSWMKR